MVMRIVGVVAGLCLGLAGALSLAGGAAFAQTAEPVRTDPSWAVKPKLEEIWEYYPKLATLFEVSGGALLACRVEATTDLADCQVEQESPKGFGFGQAAAAVAYAHMKVRPATIDGKPDPTTTVTIPINFNAPAKPTAARPALPPHTRADLAAMADKAAQGDEIFLFLQRLVAGMLGDMEGGGQDADPAVAQAFMTAGREEVRAREAALHAIIVDFYAQALGETRLRSISTAAGPRSSSISEPELEPLLRLLAYEMDDITIATKAKACAKVNCRIERP